MEGIEELLKSEKRVKWLFTGDSITHGVLYTFGSRDYVQLFEERLRFELARPLDLVIRTAVSGWTVPQVLNNIEWNILQFKPDVVSIMLGMNDADRVSPTDFAQGYRKILDILKENGDPRVLLHTPNPIVPGHNKVRDENLPSVVEEIRKIGAERGIHVVDHWAEWQSLERIFPWMGDTIHPNAQGHMAFARRLFKDLGIWNEESAVCRYFVY